jgi:hypothetical protein
MSAAPPEIAIAALGHAVGNDRGVLAGLGQLRAPVVAINPDARPTDTQALRRHGVKAVLVSGVGHFLMLEDPDRFNRLLGEVIETFRVDDIPAPGIRVTVGAPRRYRAAGCSPAAHRPASRTQEPPGVPVIADAQPPTSRQPGDRPFRLPAVAAQPLGGLDPTAGDADLDPTARQVGAAAAMVVGLMSM